MFVEVMSASRFVLQPDLSRVHAEPLPPNMKKFVVEIPFQYLIIRLQPELKNFKYLQSRYNTT